VLEREAKARTADRKAHWANLRMYNDHAYFVMLFAQLEQHIDNRCAALIAKKQSAAKWESRRLWDSADVDRMTFMRKVALLTDKGQARYAQIDAYYDTRCKIAHGDSASVGLIALHLVATDLQIVAKALRAN
jgi:hypothetical protein